MPDQTPRSAPAPLSLPDNPNVDWLRKQAKRRLAELREANPHAQLADAQYVVAKQYRFPSWRALKAHIGSLVTDGQLFDAAKIGNVTRLAALLDEHPEKLLARAKPYEWSLLHHAASNGHLAAVDLLLRRGLDVNTREKGDNTYAMHWAAAAGHLEVVRRLAAALRRAEESPGDDRAVARTRRRSVGRRWLRAAGGGVRECTGDRSARHGEDRGDGIGGTRECRSWTPRAARRSDGPRCATGAGRLGHGDVPDARESQPD
jgi:hypothetical protein